MAIIIAVMVAVKKIKQKLRSMSSVMQMAQYAVKDIEKNIERPKSVCNMTNVYLPMIEKDFPHFNWTEVRSSVERSFYLILAAISSGDLSGLNEQSDDIKEMAQNIVSQNKNSGIVCTYKDIKINDTTISCYKKAKNIATIDIEMSVGYNYTKMRNGKLIDGNENLLTQTKYRLSLTYSQNVDSKDNSVSITCPNCGAPITNFGDKFCEYCGTSVIEINMNIWKLTYFKEITAQKI